MFAAVPPGRGPAQQPPAQAAADTGRFDGEYGLMIRIEEDSLVVGWITRAAGPGIVQVSAGATVLYEDVTAAGVAHRVSIPLPEARDILLRYGGYEDAADRHEMRIDLASGARRDGVDFPATDSLFIVGDIHGEFDTLVGVLRNAGVLDTKGRWSAGRQRLVVVGDVVDRGADATRLLWFLHGLEHQARAAGGRVHVLLGNHEIMVLLGDLRYVAPKEARLATLHGVAYDRMFEPRETLLGRWLAAKPALVRIGDVLFAHGGVSADYLDYTLESFADTLAAFTAEELFQRWADTTFVPPLDSAALARRNDLFWGENSVLWYRGYAQSDTLANELDAVLDRFDARLHVVGHTPGAAVREAYDGSLILTNTLPFAAEMLLLVREGEDWARYRVGTDGPPRPLDH